MKKFLTLLMVLVLALALVACTPKAEEPAGGDTPTEEKIKVCFTATALGDNSFTDSCANGLREAEADFGIDLTINQVGDDGVVNAVREAAQNGFDIVVCGYGSDIRAMLDAESKDYPDTIFFLYDCTDSSYVPNDNILAVMFSANESDFVCGAVAACMSESKVAGFIGGQENVGIYDFLVGYVNGVKYADDTASTAYSFVAGATPWSDPAKGKELTKALYNNYGADIMHGVAGQSGDGVIEAVLELRQAGDANVWDIGVDSDQYAVFMNSGKEEKAEVILTSSMKKVAQPVYDLIKVIIEGGTPELGNRVYGIAEGAAGCADNENFQANANEAALAIADKITEDVVSGALTVQTAYGMSIDELNTLFAATTVNFVGVSM